jgi:DnaJ-class molecular chaperone
MFAMPMDYYRLLGLSPEASPAQIKEAYRALAFEYHPDRNGKSPDSPERMQEINEAYAVLSRPERRRQYDTLRKHYGASASGRLHQAVSREEIFRETDIRQVFEEMTKVFGFRSFDEIIRDIYGPEDSGKAGSAKPKGSFAPLGSLTDELIRAARFILGGFRKVGGLLRRMTGKPKDVRGADRVAAIRLTPELAREGGSLRYRPRSQAKTLLVRIPPGIREGQKIRLAGMGDAGKGAGRPGDLFLKVSIRTPLLKRIKDFFELLRPI